MIWKLFIQQKVYLVFVGLIFGVFFSHIELFNFDDPFSNIPDLTSITPIQPNINQIHHSSHGHPLDELLMGLKHGLHPMLKHTDNVRNESKNVRMLYIVGNEGSGHHLWENIMIEMTKHSDLVTANYIHNEKLLTKLLHACYIEILHEKKTMIQIRESPELTYYKKAMKVNNASVKEGDFVNYACDAFQDEFSKIFEKLPNNSLIYMRSFSYPYFEVSWKQIPMVPKLVEIAEIIGFDVKLIVMKRQWINALVSSCVHRFGSCYPRIVFTHFVLSVIQSHLFALDTKCWIMIDYEDFVSRPLEYVDIVDEWLKIGDKQLINKTFKKIIKPSSTSLNASGWNELRKRSRSNVKLLRNLYYSEYSRHLWPVYDSPYFLVTPENDGFIQT